MELQQPELDVRQPELPSAGVRRGTRFARRALPAVGGDDFLSAGAGDAFDSVQREAADDLQPGLVTGVSGLAPISIYYFVNVFDKNFYVWSDYILAPLYWES